VEKGGERDGSVLVRDLSQNGLEQLQHLLCSTALVATLDHLQQREYHLRSSGHPEAPKKEGRRENQSSDPITHSIQRQSSSLMNFFPLISLYIYSFLHHHAESDFVDKHTELMTGD